MRDSSTVHDSPEDRHTAPMLLNLKALCSYLGLGKSQIWLLSASGDLPKPIYPPSCRRALWRRDEVDEAIVRWTERRGRRISKRKAEPAMATA
jgi:predicted DNA-binding transcriptional regulator AlpA